MKIGNNGADNIRQLALRPDIAQAVKDGKLRLIPVTDVRQGMEELTGVPFATIIEKAEQRLDAIRAEAKKGGK